MEGISVDMSNPGSNVENPSTEPSSATTAGQGNDNRTPSKVASDEAQGKAGLAYDSVAQNIVADNSPTTENDLNQALPEGVDDQINSVNNDNGLVQLGKQVIATVAAYVKTASTGDMDSLNAEKNAADECTALNEALQSTKKRLKQYQTWLDEVTSHAKRLEGLHAIAQQDKQRFKNENRLLRIDNEKLRAEIVTMGKIQGPAKGEEYYIKRFDELKSDIESWAAKHSKLHRNEELSQVSEVELLKSLSELGRCGTMSCQSLKSKTYPIRKLYDYGPTRIGLIRHVVAVFLFDQVFEQFAPGVPQTFSHGLRRIEDDIILHETRLNNALTIRQAIGRAAWRSVDDKDRDLHYQELIVQLQNLLNHLLPKSGRAVHEISESVITKACALKHDMVEELAVYQCFWYNSGENFDARHIRLATDTERGMLLMCTFPGLARTIRNEKGLLRICVVKASAKLDSVFPAESHSNADNNGDIEAENNE